MAIMNRMNISYYAAAGRRNPFGQPNLSSHGRMPETFMWKNLIRDTVSVIRSACDVQGKTELHPLFSATAIDRTEPATINSGAGASGGMDRGYLRDGAPNAYAQLYKGE
jgi:hypothetical protein